MKNGVPYCYSTQQWSTGCGEVNQKWTCVQPIPNSGINFGSGNPPATINDANGVVKASNPQGTAMNYSPSYDNFQGQYAYQGPGSSTGQGTEPGQGQGQIDTSGLAQDATVQGIKGDTGDIKNALDGTADVTSLGPGSRNAGIEAMVDGLSDLIGSDTVDESNWLTASFPLPSGSTCAPYQQNALLSVFNVSFDFDPCTALARLRLMLGYAFYGYTFFFLLKLVSSRPGG
ncbi:MAG: hypothetical protein ACRERU_02600 [Methylococcales bacterium]